MSSNFSHTGKSILPLGLGTHGLGHAFGGVDEDETVAIFGLLSNSVTGSDKVLVDTAPRYGHGTVESRLGRFIASHPNHFLIATKGGRHITPEKDNQKDWSRDFLRKDLEGSLKRLGTDKVFLYQLHNPDIDTIHNGDVFAYLEDFRTDGLIDWYGVSINYPEEGLAAIDVCGKNNLYGFVSIQSIYSLFNKSGFGTLMRRAKESNVAIIAREVMMRGFLSGKYLGNVDLSNAPSAIKKLVNLYGEPQLEACVAKFGRRVAASGLSMAQAAIAYSLANSGISITLAGINRVRHFSEDWSAIGMTLPKKTAATLDKLEDIEPMAT